ncbi:hypothetical protein GCM10020221_23480 [Streptomyces thioluteus]|uniref:DUF397 domain-containing protein n=1 Tax=Streptomyces thioluteus TaxID=66431 RepID=A0ABP6JAB1_STRTU
MTRTNDLPTANWRKSSHSTNGGNCLEVGDLIPTESAPSTGTVPIRDSKHPTGPALLIPTPTWQAFLRSLTPQWQASQAIPPPKTNAPALTAANRLR